MNRKIDDFLIKRDMSIYEAAKIIDSNLKKTAFLVEDGILKGVVSDGDLRRFLLEKGDINSSVESIINFSPHYVYSDEIGIDYRQYMIDHAINALPVVDRQKKLIRIEFLDSVEAVFQLSDNVPVVIMAGGKGTRLTPYTNILPKPLIPVGDCTITEHIMNRFIKYGCKDFILILNYKKNLIEAYFGEAETKGNIQFVEEQRFLGTAGGLSLIREQINEGNFFVTNCDILILDDFHEIYQKHLENKNLITVIVVRKTMEIPYGTISCNDNDEIVNMQEKPSMDYVVNTGMYVCKKEIFDYIEDNEVIDMPDLIRRCMDAGEKTGIFEVHYDAWLDMGQPEELKKMKIRLGVS